MMIIINQGVIGCKAICSHLMSSSSHSQKTIQKYSSDDFTMNRKVNYRHENTKVLLHFQPRPLNAYEDK